MEGVFAGSDRDKPRLFQVNTTWSGLGRGGEEGSDKRGEQQRKKLTARERAPSGLAISHGEWWGASQGLKNIKSG